MTVMFIVLCMVLAVAGGVMMGAGNELMDDHPVLGFGTWFVGTILVAPLATIGVICVIQLFNRFF